MGERSKIEWTHHTFNPWLGCAKVSEGCKNCYAEVSTPVRVSRSKGLELWGEGARRRIASEAMWREPLRWSRAAKADGERRRVFCASLADIFEDYAGPDAEDVNRARARLFELVDRTPNLVWLFLTKRPDNVLRLVPPRWTYAGARSWPYNAWIGFTAENQRRFDERWEHARRIPSPVIFTSIEPQIGRVVLPEDYLARGQRVWPISGGESGPGARPFDIGWARSIVLQCRASRVPVFVKQLGTWIRGDSSDLVVHRCLLPDGSVFVTPIIGERASKAVDGANAFGLCDLKGGDPSEWPEDLRVREVPRC